jgi:putative hemolysin
VESAESEGVVEAAEAELVEEALEFGQILVRSVMVPRVDVRAIDGETTFSEAVAVFFSTGFSRLPVYDETPDAVLGILYVKDTFQVLWTDREAESKPVKQAIRPAYFVPESKPIDELLQELKAQRTHVAIVVDEYGGMAGLATLEDLIEELVGDISDEFDPGHELVMEVEPGVLEADGRISLNDLLDRLDIDREALEPFEAESIGGLIADRLGRIPAAGDTVETGPLRLEVRSMDGYRVALVRVERRDQRPQEPDQVEAVDESG